MGVLGAQGVLGAVPPPASAVLAPPCSAVPPLQGGMLVHDGAVSQAAQGTGLGAASQPPPLFGMPCQEGAQLKLMLLLPGASVGKVVANPNH